MVGGVCAAAGCHRWRRRTTSRHRPSNPQAVAPSSAIQMPWLAGMSSVAIREPSSSIDMVEAGKLYTSQDSGERRSRHAELCAVLPQRRGAGSSSGCITEPGAARRRPAASSAA
jgi:hypothetical protein